MASSQDLEARVRELEEIIKQERARADNAEEQRIRADEQRIRADEQRIKAEEQRIKAEEQRIKADEQRIKADEQRIKADEQRAKADEQRTKAEEQRTKAEEQVAKKTFADFLYICHTDVFMQLEVQKNELLATTGGLTSVDGKCYPRRLQPWAEFNTQLEENFSLLEKAFQEQQLFPSAAGLEYLASKLAGQKLASEADLKNFECLAVEGCVLDITPRFIQLVNSGAATLPSIDNGGDTNPTLKAVTFNSYPFGVIATESDEEEDESEAETQQDGDPSHQTPGRGRTRNRFRPVGNPLGKPLVIKDDRAAYVGALGVAKRDMDAAAERIAAEAEERERSGPARKRVSPERTKLHPDQWCFRHSTDDTMRPLFVVEYKAAHKIDGTLLRSSLMPQEVGSLMEDAIRMAAGRHVDADYAKRDVAKVITQVFHYMVDYGLQYSYATTGEALIFFYLDPDQPSTLYYHLEEPKLSVKSAEREAIKHSAVALVMAFVLASMKGQYMTQRWKKSVHDILPKWPDPYEDMSIPHEDSSSDTPGDTPPAAAKITLAPRRKTAGGAAACGDPQKPTSRRRRDHEDDSDPDDSTFQPGKATRVLATRGETLLRRTTRSSSTRSAPGAAPAPGDSRQAVWAIPPNAVLSPTLAYCTQACLLGLKTGGKKDSNCPNAELHRRHDVVDGPAVDNERHPISAEELRARLVQQLAEDMDHDCHSLEQYGMFGAIGALFKIALSEFGYCFVGKGVQRAHRKRLEKETLAYGLLDECQGRLVPVNLGIIQLVDEYWTTCGAHISHMMLMSFGGQSLWHHGRRTGNHELYRREMLRTLKEIKPYGLVHGDENNNNMVWNEELQRVMVIDFDHSVVLQQPSRGPDKRRRAPEDGNALRPKRAKALLEEGDSGMKRKSAV